MPQLKRNGVLSGETQHRYLPSYRYMKMKILNSLFLQVNIELTIVALKDARLRLPAS